MLVAPPAVIGVLMDIDDWARRICLPRFLRIAGGNCRHHRNPRTQNLASRRSNHSPNVPTNEPACGIVGCGCRVGWARSGRSLSVPQILSELEQTNGKLGRDHRAWAGWGGIFGADRAWWGS